MLPPKYLSASKPRKSWAPDLYELDSDLTKEPDAVIGEGATDSEFFHQRFRNFLYVEFVGPRKTLIKLRNLCLDWLQPETHTKEEIVELLVLEQYLTILPERIKPWVRAKRPQSCEKLVTLLEKYKEMYEPEGETARMMGPPGGCMPPASQPQHCACSGPDHPLCGRVSCHRVCSGTWLLYPQDASCTSLPGYDNQMWYGQCPWLETTHPPPWGVGERRYFSTRGSVRSWHVPCALAPVSVDLWVWCPRNLYVAAVREEEGTVTAVSPPRYGRKLKCDGLTQASHGGGVIWGMGWDSPFHHLGELVRVWAKDGQTLSRCLVSSQTTAVTSTVKTAWAGRERNPHPHALPISTVSNQ